MIGVLLSLSGNVHAINVAKGRIKGIVVNRTMGEKLVSNQEVTLHVYVDGREIDQEIPSVETDAEGRFEFTGLATSPDYAYSISLNYQGAEYNSEGVGFTEKETTKTINMTVYDSTTSDEEIKVHMQHIVIEVGEGVLLIREFFLFSNQGKTTFIGDEEVSPGKRRTLRFSLPKGSAELKLERGLMDCCLVSEDGVFFDTMDLKPGMKEVVFSYQTRYGASGYTFRRFLDYDTDALDLFVPSGEVRVVSDVLEPKGTVESNGRSYSHLTARGLERNKEIVVELSHLPESQYSFKWMVIVLVVLIIASGVGYPILRKRRAEKGPTPKRVDEVKERLLRERGELLFSLAELDERFEAGQIPEEDYLRERAEKKKSLIELMRRLG